MLQNVFRRYIFSPLRYSLSGLKFALQDRSFRLEITFGLIFYFLLIIKFHFSWKSLLLTIGYFLILIVEMINCAIEKVVDLASPNIHPLAKRAKDMASAAVLLTLCLFFIILLYCFFV